jgi:hypothetical protein
MVEDIARIIADYMAKKLANLKLRDKCAPL